MPYSATVRQYLGYRSTRASHALPLKYAAVENSGASGANDDQARPPWRRSKRSEVAYSVFVVFDASPL